jgi:hypothetical protein
MKRLLIHTLTKDQDIDIVTVDEGNNFGLPESSEPKLALPSAVPSHPSFFFVNV